MYAHLVFSTKGRAPMIGDDWQDRMHEVFGGIVAQRRGILLAAGGMPDHVHLLVSLGREWSVSVLLREVKAGTSRWIHEALPHLSAFAWQTGYGAFSVSVSNLEAVKQYIGDQKRHHQSMTYQDEFRALLSKHGISWDEKYIWD
jgi:REP element-mobilizing transposase RayT